jgi:cation:H+ antiporter
MITQIVIFIASIFILSWLSSRLVVALEGVARYLHWREFIVAFFVMAFAASLPNLLVDINASMNHMPEMAFGDIMGGNLVDLTLIVAVAILFGKKSLSSDSDMVQKSALFTAAIAILPAILVWDRNLSRIDGFILILAFFIYAFWLFSKDDRFKKNYRGPHPKTAKNYFIFLVNIAKIIIFLALLILASNLIVDSAKMFSDQLGLSLSMVGILIVGLGNCLPEGYFSIISAKRGEGWMILGNLMGSIIVPATLVLGIIGVVWPFEIKDLSPFMITRVFTIITALLFIIFVRSGNKLTKKEGLIFLSIT